MQQTWHDLLFAHWPIPVRAMRGLVPSELTLDTWEGNCWIGVVPFYHLPYFHARMHTESKGDDTSYHSLRPESGGEFRGMYRPVAAVKRRPAGTFEHWLTERYCLYTVHAGCVYRGDVHHEPWPLRDAAAEISINSVATAAGVTLPLTPPVLHFARRLDVVIWGLREA